MIYQKVVKESPILFKTEMVEAILAGKKFCTRRKVKGIPLDWLATFTPEYVGNVNNNLSPYGYKGDILWVKETYQETTFLHPSDDNYGYVYKASENGRDWAANDESWKWKPSMFMPKKAARLWLEIESIHIERLLDITIDDAIKEGVKSTEINSDLFKKHIGYKNYTATDFDDPLWFRNPIFSFMSLWDSINPKNHSFKNNWVWVINFKIA